MLLQNEQQGQRRAAAPAHEPEHRQRRRRILVKRLVELIGWLIAILILLYASHAAFAQLSN